MIHAVLFAVCFVAVDQPQDLATALGADQSTTSSTRDTSADDPVTATAWWVFLADKSGAAGHIENQWNRDAALQQRWLELSDKCRTRRSLRRTATGQIDERDLDLCSAYRDRITANGATIRQTSRWLNAVSIIATPQQRQRIAVMPFVTHMQPVAVARRELPVAEPLPDTANGFTTSGALEAWYGGMYAQLQQMGVVDAHQLGYTGAGIVIGILDTGFRTTHNSLNQTTLPAHPVQVLGSYDFINDDAIVGIEVGDPASQHSHGTYVLGTIGAFHPNFLVGAAYDASFYLAKTEDVSQEVQAEEDYYVAGLEWIESNGADIATSSLGYIDWYTQADLDGATAVTTIAVNIATANGLICCTAAGNNGHDANQLISHLIAPADAIDVITCGAVTDTGAISSFSSDGPSADLRVKPEILSRGTGAVSITSNNNTGTVSVNGTSFSTPLIAGGVALIVQAHPDWSINKMRRALLHTAGDFIVNADYDPTYVRGYGIINVAAAIEFVHSDINGDGLADGNDIQPFVMALKGANPDANQTRRADINADGRVNTIDIPIFVADLLEAN